MSPNQELPSFSLALHPDPYKTVLTKLSYPSQPGSSAPLVFSVSQTVFFFFVFAATLHFFGPQKTTRPEIAVANPAVQVSYTFSSI